MSKWRKGERLKLLQDVSLYIAKCTCLRVQGSTCEISNCYLPDYLKKKYSEDMR